MGIKDINEIIRQGVVPRRKERFSERIKKIDPKYTSMSEVVPPLNRGDFLRTWQADRIQLEKVRKERDDAVKESKRLKGLMQTNWSKDWRSKLNEKEKVTRQKPVVRLLEKKEGAPLLNLSQC